MFYKRKYKRMREEVQTLFRGEGMLLDKANRDALNAPELERDAYVSKAAKHAHAQAICMLILNKMDEVEYK